MKTVLGCVSLFGAIVASHPLFLSLPNREEEGPGTGALQVTAIEISREGFAPLTLVGAWRLTSDDRRFGGVSGLAIDGDQLVAITDSAVVLRFPKSLGRRSAVWIDELPAGPGSPRLKRNRDSEALAADPRGRGWWVRFENRNELWLYDRAFARALHRRSIPGRALGKNKGVEGLTSHGPALLLFPESGRRALRLDSGGWHIIPIESPVRLADAAATPDGRLLVVQRQLTLMGFRNSVAYLRPSGRQLRTVWRKRLPVAWYDNVEAMAVEPLGTGGYRLWMMTDDNFHPRLRTVLLVVELPKKLLEQP